MVIGAFYTFSSTNRLFLSSLDHGRETHISTPSATATTAAAAASFYSFSPWTEQGKGGRCWVQTGW